MRRFAFRLLSAVAFRLPTFVWGYMPLRATRWWAHEWVNRYVRSRGRNER